MIEDLCGSGPCWSAAMLEPRPYQARAIHGEPPCQCEYLYFSTHSNPRYITGFYFGKKKRVVGVGSANRRTGRRVFCAIPVDYSAVPTPALIVSSEAWWEDSQVHCRVMFHVKIESISVYPVSGLV